MVQGELFEAVRASGLFARDRPVVAMLSGGRDSVCLLDIAVTLLGPQHVSALHVNYRLRQQADDEERHCAALCQRLAVELHVLTVGGDGSGEGPGNLGNERHPGNERYAGEENNARNAGNLQAWARGVRYREAARLARERDALIATGHTASDQVETILYRLAASPGRRALLGMPAGDGRLIRPLLALTREQTAEHCRSRGLSWCEDPSNQDQRYARSRVRHQLLLALRTVHPAAEANVLRTAQLLREETELLDGLVSAELAGRREITLARLRELPAALARMVVVRLAEDAAGTYVPQAGERVEEILALARRRVRAELHVGGQAGAVIEDGLLRMIRLPPRE